MKSICGDIYNKTLFERPRNPRGITVKVLGCRIILSLNSTHVINSLLN